MNQAVQEAGRCGAVENSAVPIDTYGRAEARPAGPPEREDEPEPHGNEPPDGAEPKKDQAALDELPEEQLMWLGRS